ncbi:uncharacterized protein KGF55_001149 [Candida pseudojiufengensis]|uniref:uncharacterized protein n=1 Tax=Candida pseudojiufengensis TaxID=497109 RepID=UPI002224BB4B|nr:uncharacterized protein KGF55_001149 [Candida pseudojiufengensis]KAI5965786.1 hypothetical protein KGF55_001149 [Candida pseudojiufengensis]
MKHIFLLFLLTITCALSTTVEFKDKTPTLIKRKNIFVCTTGVGMTFTGIVIGVLGNINNPKELIASKLNINHEKEINLSNEDVEDSNKKLMKSKLDKASIVAGSGISFIGSLACQEFC